MIARFKIVWPRTWREWADQTFTGIMWGLLASMVVVSIHLAGLM